MLTLQDLLREKGIDYREAGSSSHVTEGWIGVICPYCGQGTGKYGMGLSLTTFAAQCWKCGKHKYGTVLTDLFGENPKNGRKYLSALNRLAPLNLEPLEGVLRLPPGVGELLPAHRFYLENRGFNPDEISRVWDVKGIGITLKYFWRLFIPIIYQGRTISWTTRAIVDEGKRYDAAPKKDEAFPAKNVLYGIDHVRSVIVVHEGPTDVWRIGPGATCTFGLGYTDQQVRLISRYPTRVIVFDSDSKAQEKARELCDELSVFPGRTIRCELDAKDPGSASLREVKRFRRAFLE